MAALGEMPGCSPGLEANLYGTGTIKPCHGNTSPLSCYLPSSPNKKRLPSITLHQDQQDRCMEEAEKLKVLVYLAQEEACLKAGHPKSFFVRP